MTLVIRELHERDVDAAERIFRLAFGTFLELPDPLAFAGDTAYVRTRWRTAPEAAFGAYLDDTLVGSNFATVWGSFGVFGPLSVRPDLWNAGVARALLDRTHAHFDAAGVAHAAIFTFPTSPKHIALYQRYDYWPQHLVLVMSKPAEAAGDAPLVWSGLSEEARQGALGQIRRLTNELHPGLDPSSELLAVARQGIGDTVLTMDGEALTGFAICHEGAGSEAGSGTLFVKFGATAGGPGAEDRFDRLLAACEALAAARGLGKVAVGANTARHPAYRRIIARGYRAELNGLAMQRGNRAGYARPDCFVIDDWR